VVCQLPLLANGREAYCHHQSQSWFTAGNEGKFLAMNVNGLSAISFCISCPTDGNKNATNFCLSHRNSFFDKFKEQVPSKFKNKISAVQRERKIFRLI
jgi:hypothetical protein